ncbi:MAG: hypothetical protein SNG02_05770 [Rikenellaceae bacterium]
MKKIIQLSLFIFTLVCGSISTTYGQEGQIVSNITLSDLNQKAVQLPHFGSKSLMIFYVDPDRAGQNDEFIKELRNNTELRSNNVMGVSIMNVKDAPMIPNGLAYRMAQKRSDMMHTPFYVDETGELSTKWKLGDCDNFSVIMLVNTQGEIIFLSRGKITPEDKERFYSSYATIK